MPRPTFEQRLHLQPLFDVNASRASLLYGDPSPCPTQPLRDTGTPTAVSYKMHKAPRNPLRGA